MPYLYSVPQLASSVYADIPALSDAIEHIRIGDEGEMHWAGAMCFLTYIGLKNLVPDPMLALQNLPAVRLLPSPVEFSYISDLLRFTSFVVTDDFDIKLVIPLLNSIWIVVYGFIIKSTPLYLSSYLDNSIKY